MIDLHATELSTSIGVCLSDQLIRLGEGLTLTKAIAPMKVRSAITISNHLVLSCIKGLRTIMGQPLKYRLDQSIKDTAQLTFSRTILILDENISLSR